MIYNSTIRLGWVVEKIFIIILQHPKQQLVNPSLNLQHYTESLLAFYNIIKSAF